MPLDEEYLVTVVCCHCGTRTQVHRWPDDDTHLSAMRQELHDEGWVSREWGGSTLWYCDRCALTQPPEWVAQRDSI